MVDLLSRWDEALLLWIHHGWRCRLGDQFFPWITSADQFVLPLALLWAGLLLFGGRGGRRLALLLVLCLVVTDQISSQLIKPWVDRTRPCFALGGVSALIPQPHSPSFPSGHAATRIMRPPSFTTGNER